MGIDDRGDVVLLGDLVDQVVDDDRGLRIEARVGLVAEEVARVQDDRARDGHALDHAARQLRRVEIVGVFEPHAPQAEIHALAFLGLRLIGEEIQRQADVLRHGRRVQQRTALKDHADVLADRLALLESERRIADVVVEDLPRIDGVQPHQTFQQHGFARTALPDDEIRLSGLELHRDVVEHRAPVERLEDMFRAYHVSRICVRIRLKIMMTIDEATTARVEALPTSSELPLA